MVNAQADAQRMKAETRKAERAVLAKPAGKQTVEGTSHLLTTQAGDQHRPPSQSI